MITSKIDKATRTYTEALQSVTGLLKTERGSSAARQELSRLRFEASETGCCSYCGADLLVAEVSQRHSEACKACGATFDRMLQLKSRVLSGAVDPDAVKQLAKSYDSFTYVPYSLRGTTGNAYDVVDALNFLHVAALVYKNELKAQRIRDARCHIMEKRKKDLRNMLMQCGMSEDNPELESLVEELYADRYFDD